MGRDAKAFAVDKILPDTPPGAIHFTMRYSGTLAGFQHNCPCGCGLISFMGLDPEVNTEYASWKLTAGNFRDPISATLSPSIGIGKKPDGSYHWHGYLENGVFVER